MKNNPNNLKKFNLNMNKKNHYSLEKIKKY